MREIRKAHFLYIANIDGYIGQSAATEMAYAKLKDLPIITAEPIRKFATEVPEEIREILKKIAFDTLPISDISKEKIAAIKQKLIKQQPESVSEDERKNLRNFVKALLKELWNLHRESH